MSTTEPTQTGVAGERDAHSVTRILSVQSRISNVLAIGLMSALGLGSLTWYYAQTMMRQGRAQEAAKAASANRAQGDLPLPSLGRIVPPTQTTQTTQPILAPAAESVAPPSPIGDVPPQTARTLMEVPVAQSAPPLAGYGAPPVKSPEELALERELSGTVFASQSAAPAGTADPVGGSVPAGMPAPAGMPDLGGSAAARREPGQLATLLRPTASAAVRAQLLPAQRLLLPKGAFIDCTLETAIDSTLPGMTTCVMATDVFGVDGKVVLLERGTKLIGETRGQVEQGAARIFVLWTEARSPTGVIVPLDSPGADELGRSGLPGEVNRHFWERFGAAMLVSVVDGAVQAAAQSAHGGSGNVVVNPSSSQDVLTEILKNTISVPPTVTKQNGDRIQVLVARDVDFRSVYELRSVAAGR
jgi:type IV secretion system protein VirB10